MADKVENLPTKPKRSELPSRYGPFYEKFEHDQELIEYYKKASFFDVWDLQSITYD